MEEYSINTASFDLIIISSSMVASGSATIDLSAAAYISGTFVGIGSQLSQVTASFISVGSNTTASFSISSSHAINARTASHALNALTASFALATAGGPGGGTTLFTGSTYQITSSWANNAISASWAPPVPSDSASFASTIPGNKGKATVLFTQHTAEPVSASITGQTNISASANIQATIYASNDDIFVTMWAPPVIYNVINAQGFSIYIRPMWGTYSGSVDVFWTWRP